MDHVLIKSCRNIEKLYEKLWIYDNYKNKRQSQNKHKQKTTLNKNILTVNKNLWNFVNAYARTDNNKKQVNCEMPKNGDIFKDDRTST